MTTKRVFIVVIAQRTAFYQSKREWPFFLLLFLEKGGGVSSISLFIFFCHCNALSLMYLPKLQQFFFSTYCYLFGLVVS